MQRSSHKKLIKSIKGYFLVGSLLIAILPSILLFIFNIRSVKRYYREKSDTFQENEISAVQSRMDYLGNQIESAAENAIGIIISSRQFVGYSDSNAIEKYRVEKEVRQELSSVMLNYQYVDNIIFASFDQQIFTPNTYINAGLFFDSLRKPLDEDQAAYTDIVPTRDIDYSKTNISAKSSQKVISYCKYLNRYTPGSAIGLVQVDIDYKTLNSIISASNISDDEFYVILDSNDDVVYPIDLEESRSKLVDEYIGDNTVSNNSQIGSYITREKEINSFGWKILQFSSDNAYTDAVNSTTLYWVIITIICLLLAFVLAWLLSYTMNKSVTSMTSMMINASSTNFYIDSKQISLDEFRKLSVAINDMNTMINSLMQENIKKEREKLSLEIDALGSKINSHFLYNTLNLIKMMSIKEGQMDIAKIIVALSEILQYSYKDSTFMVPLYKEIEFTRNYTYIQTVRFHKNIDIDYEIDDTISSVTVPKMILQPIVENSILHAFENNDSDNQILISAQYSSKDKKKLEIYIEDNGIGFNYQGLDHLTGIGLKNVIQRLTLYYGDELSYKIDSKINEGTSVTLIFPITVPEK